ncbi:YgjP-like metallopeptidase domain-containing protein [Streptomyces erythrochromogenes]|uniref:YgjP-like metallopeptidase domain-containing protein n=1 Tax=Streptomyces erythrochromogenes TaxID=285574 RepID=UPI0038108202
MTNKATRTASHGGVTIKIKTSDRTTTDLSVTPHEGITVHGPHTLTDDDARELVTRRKYWVYRELTKLCEQAPANPTRTLRDGEQFTILGIPAQPPPHRPPAPHRSRSSPQRPRTRPRPRPRSGNGSRLGQSTPNPHQPARRRSQQMAERER